MHHTHEPTAVANLLYRYAEYIDTGDFDGAAALFERATIWARPAFGAPAREISHKELREHWQNVTVLHDDGTPRTKHLITNPIIEIAEDEATASIRSYYTVLHALDQFPLQPIAAGRYHDRFARDADRWYFTYRDYTLMDLRGDLSTHLASSWEARES